MSAQPSLPFRPPFVGVAEQIIHQGYAMMDFPVDAQVVPVLDYYRKTFLQLPQEVKDLWNVDIFHDDPNDELGRPSDPDHGYIKREGGKRHIGEGVYDGEKEFFHFKKRTLVARAQKVPGLVIGDHQGWIDIMTRLHSTCEQRFFEICEALDYVLSGFNFLEGARIGAEKNANTLRLLQYGQASAPGQVIAKRHPDRAFLTIHLDETHQGLQVDLPAGKLHYEKKPGQVLVFPSAKFKLRTKGEVMPLVHGVVATNETATDRRGSAIFFAHDDTVLFTT